MKRELNGKELQGYVQQRQQRQVASLGKDLKLAIVIIGVNPVIDTYVKLKERYGEEIGVEVATQRLSNHEELKETIVSLNKDSSTDGIIVQLPVEGLEQPQELLNTIAPGKDVDGLSDQSQFDPATPIAILWLLNGFNVELQQGKKITIVGQGKLVGKPLLKMMQSADMHVTGVDEYTENSEEIIKNSDVVVSAVGKPGLITSEMIKQDATVVDAGTTSMGGTIVGDVSDDVFERDDVTITPLGGRGGVGPLTITALFDNLIKAASIK